MDDYVELGHVFGIPDLYKQSWLLQLQNDSEHLFSQLSISDTEAKLPNVIGKQATYASFFSPPEILTEEQDNPDSHESADESLETTSSEDAASVAEPWALLCDPGPVDQKPSSWDAFPSSEHVDSPLPYITEAGSSTYDVIIRDAASRSGGVSLETHIVDRDFYLSCLLNLGLGRDSLLFGWHNDDVTSNADVRLSGYTVQSLTSLLAIFIECGRTWRNLRDHVRQGYNQPPSSTHIAFAYVVACVLDHLEIELSTSSLAPDSVLQLQARFRRPHELLVLLHRLAYRITQTSSPQEVISSVYDALESTEDAAPATKDLLRYILNVVCEPWFESVAEWIGLRPAKPTKLASSFPIFVRTEIREWIDEHGLAVSQPHQKLALEGIPSFVTRKEAEVMFEVGKNLQLLREHEWDHHLVVAEAMMHVSPPDLQLAFSSQDIDDLQAAAYRYEQALRHAIRGIPSTGRKPVEQAAARDDTGPQKHHAFFDGALDLTILDAPAFDHAAQSALSGNHHAVLRGHIKECLRHDAPEMYTPELLNATMAPMLYFNEIINARAKYVNRACLHLVLKKFALRKHLEVQKSFHLCGDGLFLTKLKHALFDPDTETAERQTGIVRSGIRMGLRLADRETWPPATSELRLALMGILSDTYNASQNRHQNEMVSETPKRAELPGDLSFAIRDLSDTEIDLCMNADSTQALDFLRLSYKPLSPLDVVITPTSLFKYDQVFRFLLKLVRIQYVASQLCFNLLRQQRSHGESRRSIIRFCIEAQHFISSLCAYTFDTGIEQPWQAFRDELTTIEQQVSTTDPPSSSYGLQDLCSLHDEVLDSILSALFLRKRQQPITKLLDDIFDCILGFAKHIRIGKTASSPDSASEDTLGVKEYQDTFRKKLGIFMTVCKGLSEKRDALGRGMSPGTRSTDHRSVDLILRLEMSGYYSEVICI